MKNASRLVRRQFLAGNAAALAAGAVVTAPAKAAQFEFRCASTLPIDHPSNVRLAQMWAAVERETNGRVRTQLFPNSLLGGEPAVFGQLRTGALQFFLISPFTLASVVPAANITNLGFALRDSNDGFRIADGPLGGYLRDESLTKGLYILRKIWDSGMYQIGSVNRAIRTPDDLHGYKIRVIESKIVFELFRALGASPVALSFNEIYTALQTRLVDGTSTPLLTISVARLYEVQKYISLTNHEWSGIWLAANADTWKSLPPDIQAIIERNNTKHALLERRDMAVVTGSVIDKLRRQGTTINPVDQTPFHGRLNAYFQSWANEFGPTVWGLLQTSLGRKLI